MKVLDVDSCKTDVRKVFFDIKEDEDKYRPQYAPIQHENSAALLTLVREAYFRSKSYRNYREKFIVVKVNKPTIADKLQNDAAFARLYAFTKFLSIEPVATKNSLLFRIPK
jgi:hypothetical protein